MRRETFLKDNSSMDGYAVRFQDTKVASKRKPAVLSIVEDLPAGAIPQKAIGKGEASRIMTGAPVPDGANAVVRVEDTEKGGQEVRIFVEATKGQDIRFTGRACHFQG